MAVAKAPQGTSGMNFHLRACGVRTGTKEAPGVYLAGEADLTSIVDPVIPYSAYEMEVAGISAQGQSAVTWNSTTVLFDVVGDDYTPFSFALEAFRKGTSNRSAFINNEAWIKAHFGELKKGIDILYLHKRAWIEEEYRKPFYDDRMCQFLAAGVPGEFFLISRDKPCPLMKPEHLEVPDQYGSYPMCWGLLPEDEPFNPKEDKKISGRLVKKMCGDFEYIGAVAPIKKVERGYGIFFRSKLSHIDVVINDDQFEADQVADLLNNLDLDIEFRGTTF